MTTSGIAAMDAVANIFAAEEQEQLPPPKGTKKSPPKEPPVDPDSLEEPDPTVPDPDAELDEVTEEPEAVEETTEESDADPDPDAEPDDPDAQADEPLEEVKVRGKTLKVTKEELKAGYSRTADYTQSKMELAEKRKAVEAKDTSLDGKLAQYDSLLEQAQTMLVDMVPKEPNWDQLRETADPAEYSRQYTDWQRLSNAKADILTERKRVLDERVQASMQKRQETIAAETTKLVEARPELKDPAKQRAFITAAFTYAQQSLGFTIEQLRELADHRALLILDKARRYDVITAKRGSTEQLVKSNVRSAQPSGKRPPAPKKSPKELAVSRLRKSGSVADLADVFLHNDSTPE